MYISRLYYALLVWQSTLKYAKQAPAKETYTQAHKYRHTTVTLYAHSLFSPLATVKAEHRGSATDTTVVLPFLFAWNAT